MSSSSSTRSSQIFHRSLRKTYPIATSGKGVYLYSSDGTRTLDGSSGAAVSCLGHGHEAVIQAIIDQAQRLAFAHTSFFSNDPAEELAQLLIERSDRAFSRVLYLSSGSEAVESAIKLSRQYYLARNEPARVNFIARESSYHGNTLGALSAGNNPVRRAPFAPLLSPVFHHVSRCFFSRDAKPEESEDTYVDRLIAELEATFISLGPETVAAVIVEPISGASLGSVPAATGYLKRLQEVAWRHGALVIFDEVMCGMGRVGTLHAWQSLGAEPPDLQTIGKGLGAGYQPISAVLVGKTVHKAIESADSTHPFVSGHTYQGHAIGCAAALATQKTIIEGDLLRNVREMGALLRSKLGNLTPNVKEVRGLGLFLTVEFQTQGNKPMAARVASICLQKGLAVYLCSSLVDAVMFAPPFIINENEIEELIRVFISSVEEAGEQE